MKEVMNLIYILKLQSIEKMTIENKFYSFVSFK